MSIDPIRFNAFRARGRAYQSRLNGWKTNFGVDHPRYREALERLTVFARALADPYADERVIEWAEQRVQEALNKSASSGPPAMITMRAAPSAPPTPSAPAASVPRVDVRVEPGPPPVVNVTAPPIIVNLPPGAPPVIEKVDVTAKVVMPPPGSSRMEFVTDKSGRITAATIERGNT